MLELMLPRILASRMITSEQETTLETITIMIKARAMNKVKAKWRQTLKHQRVMTKHQWT